MLASGKGTMASSWPYYHHQLQLLYAAGGPSSVRTLQFHSHVWCQNSRYTINENDTSVVGVGEIKNLKREEPKIIINSTVSPFPSVMIYLKFSFIINVTLMITKTHERSPPGYSNCYIFICFLNIGNLSEISLRNNLIMNIWTTFIWKIWYIRVCLN